MSIFKKEPPKVCPKCGEADGWHLLAVDPFGDYDADAAAVNPSSAAPVRSTFGQNLTGSMGGKKGKSVRYHCDSCGYEKQY